MNACALALAMIVSGGVGVYGAGGWAPPYLLPAAGVTSRIDLNKVVDIGISGWPDGDVRNACFAVFGGGAFVSDYSAGGAFVIAGSGGHGMAMVGAFVFDFATARWSRLDPQGGTTWYRSQGNDYLIAETSGDPWWEITGSSGIPSPGHPYTYNAPLPTSLGGGTKGSVVITQRAAVTIETGVIALVAHRFDLSSQTWSRYSTNGSRTPSNAFNGSSALDTARSRIWVTEGSEGWKQIQYLDLTDQTYKLMTAATNFPSNPGTATGCVFMHGGYLFKQSGKYADLQVGGLFLFDPDNVSDATTGEPWTNITANITGGTMPDENIQNPWTYVPATGKLYKLPYDGGSSMWRLTPPANLKTGTWTLDTVAISPALPKAVPQPPTDPNGYHENRFFYVSSIARLAWIPGDSTGLTDQGVYLIGPV